MLPETMPPRPLTAILFFQLDRMHRTSLCQESMERHTVSRTIILPNSLQLSLPATTARWRRCTSCLIRFSYICPVAQMYEKRIKQLVADYNGRNVAFVVIMGNDDRAEKFSELGFTDVGDSFQDMKVRAAYRSLNYPYLYDGATQSVTRKYGP